jgi:hypothetical protein
MSELKVGDKVIYDNGHWSLSNLTISTIVRETKTLWITANGQKWSKDNLCQYPKSSAWTPNMYLKPLTDERQQEFNEQQESKKLKNLWYALIKLPTPHHLTSKRLTEIMEELKTNEQLESRSKISD